MGYARTTFSALVFSAFAVVSAAPAALAKDDDHRYKTRRYEAPVVVYDRLGREIDLHALERGRFEERHRYRSDDDDDRYEYEYKRRDDRRSYGYRRDYGYAPVIVIGGFFSPDIAYGYRQHYPGRYVRYADCHDRWDRAYYVGRPFPRHLGYSPLDGGAYRYLPPAPYGHSYVRVGSDVVLLSGDGIVVDALVRLALR